MSLLESLYNRDINGVFILNSPEDINTREEVTKVLADLLGIGIEGLVATPYWNSLAIREVRGRYFVSDHMCEYHMIKPYAEALLVSDEGEPYLLLNRIVRDDRS